MMNRARFVVGCVVLLFTCMWASAEENTPTLAEAKAAWAEHDTALNAAYQKLKAKLPEHEFATLRVEQRRWLGYRDFHCRDKVIENYAEVTQANLEASPEHWLAMAQFTAVRTQILLAMLRVANGQYPAWTGEWRDGYGGCLRMVKRGDQLYVHLDVVRGPTYHLGILTAVLPVKNRLARFAAKPMNDRAETWITFLKRDGKLEIIGENTAYYHGARAYFDGTYHRVGDLSQKQQAEVVGIAKGEIDVEP